MESLKKQSKLQLPRAWFQQSEKNMKQKCLWHAYHNTTHWKWLWVSAAVYYTSTHQSCTDIAKNSDIFPGSSSQELYKHVRDRDVPAWVSVTGSASPSAWDLLILRWHSAQSWFTGPVWSHTHSSTGLESNPVFTPLCFPVGSKDNIKKCGMSSWRNAMEN